MEAVRLANPAVAIPVAEIAAALLADLETGPRARIVAQSIVDVLGDVGVAVFVVDEADPTLWSVKAIAGDISVDSAPLAVDSGVLGAAAREQSILQFDVGSISREDYAHLDVRQSLTGLTCIPLLLNERLLGCIEIVSFGELPESTVLEGIGEIARIGALALAGGAIYATERDAQLA